MKKETPYFGPKKCPVYLHLPWLGNVSTSFKTQIKTAVKCYFFAVELRIVYTTRQLLSATNKDMLPASHHSNVVYRFLRHCDNRNVNLTFQRLQQRIKHVPKSILQRHTPHDRRCPSRSSQSNWNPPEASYSTIAQHCVHSNTIENTPFSSTGPRLSIFPLLKPHTVHESIKTGPVQTKRIRL